MSDTGYNWNEYFASLSTRELHKVRGQWVEYRDANVQHGAAWLDFSSRLAALDEYLRPVKYTERDVQDLLATIGLADQITPWQLRIFTLILNHPGEKLTVR